jgi:SAM-dependent methyltransferase
MIGCGNSRDKRMCIAGTDREWKNLTTLDINPDCNPDIVWDLETLPYPLETDYYDEVHAYEVLEHCGTQGDAKFFFGQFAELHRILKPGGLLFGSVPRHDSVWAWGDPSHKRIISNASLTFLSQEAYKAQIGVTSMTDFRHVWKLDFPCVFFENKGDSLNFVLKAVK